MSNEFITTDAEEIYRGIITKLEEGVSEPLYPGDERRIFGEALVPLFVGMYNAMNDAARQKMLRYARGDVLDALGERAGVERLAPEKATTTLRFSLNESIAENIIIPEGTRATSDGSRYFATTTAAVLEAGETYVDVPAISEEGGVDYNDIPIGAITALVDLLPYIDSVSNIDVTSGGADAEQDDSLRERIRSAPSKLTTAGPINAYRYWAMSANTAIADVVVKSEQEKIGRTLQLYEINNAFLAFMGGDDLLIDTLVVYVDAANGVRAKYGDDYTAKYEDGLLTIQVNGNSSTNGAAIAASKAVQVEIDKTNDGTVNIFPICKDGDLPDEAILKDVYETCSASEVRPMTDRVVVKAPTVQEYSIELTYYTTAAEASACIKTIEGEGGAIDKYIEWQSSKLGRHINPDKLRALMLAPIGENAVGATRVEITSPSFTELSDTTIAKFNGVKSIRHEVSD